MQNERLFLALPIPDGPKQTLRALLQTIQNKHPFRKWVHPDDLHITLKFLGDTEPARVSRVQSLMKELALRCSSFQLVLEGAGIFGRAEAPSILWAGVGGDGLPALENIQAQTEEAMASIGFPPEQRPYRPHITLARKYAPAPDPPFSQTALDALSGTASPPWQADRIILYSSHLGRAPMYEVKDTFLLGTG
jgi:2'-5' RNA ligase